MNKHQLVNLCVIAFSIHSWNALAQPALPEVTFSAFGTLGYAILDDENAEYRTGTAIDGADDDGSFEVDTRLGLQMDAEFSTTLSSTFQLIAREAEDGDAAVELEWGFLRWLVTDNIAFRIGRMSLPVYSISDFREVGYAIPYLRPPEDLYSMIPLRRFNGADVTYDHGWGNALFRWQLFAGQAREEIFDDLEPDTEQAIGISLTVDQGPARLRFSHVDTTVDIDSQNDNVTALRAGLAQAQQQIPTITDELLDDFAGKAVPLTFDAISLGLDFSSFFIDLEYTRRRVDNWVSNVDGWSIAIGTRINNFHPYLYFSQLNEPDGDRRINLPDDPSLDPLEAGVNQFYEPRDQSTFGLGARYDLSPNIALKGQIERISREETGISFNRASVDDGTDEGEDVTLFSIVVDFVI